MYFRRVEHKFRCAAFLLQSALFLLLLCYVGFSLIQISNSAADPPVQATVTTWKKNLGLWALCDGSLTDTLYGVGTGQEDTIWGFHQREKALVGAKITRPQWENISKNLGPQYCAFLDLTEVELQGLFPFHFTLCIEALNYGDYFLKQEDQWEHVTQAKTGTLKVYSLGKMITGWNYGYSSFQETHFIRSSLDQPFPSVNRTMLCAAGMTYFGSERTQGSALHMVVENSVVVAYHKQGIVPQLFALFTSIGGYVTFLSIVFTSFFIKKYPESSVSEIYEARTLVFGSMWSRRKSDNETHVNFPEPLPLFSGLSKAVGKDTE